MSNYLNITDRLPKPAAQSPFTYDGSVQTYDYDGVEHLNRIAVTICVDGYWGSGISVRLDRLLGEDDPVEIHYPSGGYEDYDNVQRARNFAQAMEYAALVAEQLEGIATEVLSDLNETSQVAEEVS